MVAVIVIAGVGFTVYRLHGIFGSGHDTATPGGAGEELVAFNPKHVRLEVFGDPGTVASISYLDVHARPQHVADAPLPWSYEDTTTTPAVLTNIMAQGNGSSLGCRIVIDGAVKAERIANNPHAYTFCLDKSG